MPQPVYGHGTFYIRYRIMMSGPLFYGTCHYLDWADARGELQYGVCDILTGQMIMRGSEREVAACLVEEDFR